MSKKGRLLFGIACVLLLSLFGLYFAIQVWMPFMWFILGPAAFSFVGWLFLDRKIIFDFFTMKTTKHGLNMGALVLITLAFLTAFNILAAKKNKSFDFSGTGLRTLSPLTVKILNSLDSDLNIKFFYKEGGENVELTRKAFNQILVMYQEASNKVKVEYVEMNSNPKETTDFGANKGNGEVFVEYKGQKNRVESQFLGNQGQKYNEQDFTNAVIKVTRKEKKTVYFVEGHEEREMENEQDTAGAFAFKQLLEKNSFIIKKLNLVQATEVPADASALVILGPQSPYQKFEITALEHYLGKGGSLFLTFADKNTAGLSGLLADFGLKLDQQYIFNILNSPMGQVVNANQPTVAVDYSSTSLITRVFTSNQTAVFVKPNSLSLTSVPPLVKTDFIVKTPIASVALLKLDSSDYQGKPRAFNIIAEVSGQAAKDAKPFKAVVVADTDFLSNSVIAQNVNRDIGLNSISNLVGEDDLISISPKEVAMTKLLMSPPEFAQFFKFVVMGLFLPLPFVFLVMSIVLWLKRRHA